MKISTPSIYKKVLQLEEKGLIEGATVKEGKMPEKAVYSLTDAGNRLSCFTAAVYFGAGD